MSPELCWKLRQESPALKVLGLRAKVLLNPCGFSGLCSWKENRISAQNGGEAEVPVGIAALSVLRKLQEKGEHKNFSTETNTALPPTMCPKTRALALN